MRATWIPPVLAALSLAACASAPPLLVALPEAPSVRVPAQAVETSSMTVRLRPVTLPGYLDSYPGVLGRQANRLVVSPEAEWAERLPEAVTRVLRDALSQRLGASRVLVDGEHRAADAELVVEFLKLDSSGGSLELDARWAFVCARPRRSAYSGRTHLRVPVAAETASAVAAATANALGELAEVLARQGDDGASSPGLCSGVRTNAERKAAFR
jgi:uncharacterized lipoprotein YmbA